MNGACCNGASAIYNTRREITVEKKLFNVVRPRENDGKTYWDKHGVLIIKEGRISLHLSSIPTADWDGWFHVYARDETDANRNNGQHRRVNGQQQAHAEQDFPAAFDDDIAF